MFCVSFYLIYKSFGDLSSAVECLHDFVETLGASSVEASAIWDRLGTLYFHSKSFNESVHAFEISFKIRHTSLNSSNTAELPEFYDAQIKLGMSKSFFFKEQHQRATLSNNIRMFSFGENSEHFSS